MNPFFYPTLSKPLPQGFLAVETAMLQIYPAEYEYTIQKNNSQIYITKTYHEGKPHPLGTFVLKRSSAHVQHFDTNLNPLLLVDLKYLIDSLMLRTNFFLKMVLPSIHSEIK